MPVFDDMTTSDPNRRLSFAEVHQRLEVFLQTKDDIWLCGRVWSIERFAPPPPRQFVQRIWAKYPKSVMLPIY